MKLFRPSEQSRRPMPRRPSVVSVLDVGSTKICCLIARLTSRATREAEALRGRTHAIEVLGIGHQRSRGIKSGVVVNLDAAEQAIRLAVDAAERMAGVTVDSLIVNVSAGRLASETYSAAVDHRRQGGREGRHRPRARRRPAPLGRARAARSSTRCRSAIRSTATAASPIRAAWSATVSASTCTWSPPTQPPLRNLELSINRCHLSVEALVATPYASGLSALVDDEAELGCAVIDFGGGTTTIAVFSSGQFVHVDAIADRRPAHHHRHRPRPVDRGSRTPSG